jgi:hypothetical protein
MLTSGWRHRRYKVPFDRRTGKDCQSEIPIDDNTIRRRSNLGRTVLPTAGKRRVSDLAPNSVQGLL